MTDFAELNNRNIPIDGATIDAAFATLTGDTSQALATIVRAGAVSRSLGSRFADTLCVLDFVLAGDAGDIGLAINRAHAAANPGDRLILPGATAYTLATPVVLNRTGVGLDTGATINVVGGITAFALTGTQNWLRNVLLFGIGASSIAAGSCAVSVSGVCCLAENITAQRFDTIVLQPTGSGYGSSFRGLNLRNAGSRAVYIQDGVATTLEDVIYDTDGVGSGGFAPPSIAGLHYSAQGGLIINVDFLHCGGQGGCFIEPASGTLGAGIYWTFFVNAEFDSAVNAPGIHINNTSTSLTLIGLFFVQCWASTCNQSVLIDGSGPIELCTFDGCQFLNSSEQAIVVTNPLANNILFENCTVVGNCTGIDPYAGTAYAASPALVPCPTISLTTPGLVTFTGGRIAARDAAPLTAGNPTYHIQTAPTSGIVFLDGFSIDVSPGSHWVSQLSIGGPAGYLQIGRVVGMATKYSGTATVATAAASVTFSHGLFLTPQAQEISVSPLSPPSGMTGWYLDPTSITATQATIRILGTTTAPVVFGYKAEILGR